MRRLLSALSEIKPLNGITAFLSSAFQAFGMYNIHALSGVTEGGVLGATLLLDNWFGISPAVSGFVLNAACFFLGWKTLGGDFIAYSVLATAGFSIGYGICELFPPLWPEIAGMPLAASVSGAVFIGLGAGFCVRAGGATSGDDALAVSITALTGGKIRIEWIYLASDVVVLLLSLSYIPLRRIAYSLLTVVISGQIVGLMQKVRVLSFLSPDIRERTDGCAETSESRTSD